MAPLLSDISVMTGITIGEELPLPLEHFVLYWGHMGVAWGINRSVSQIHALLYISERPLTAEEISRILGLARSNVSNSLKELLAWDLVHRVPIKGDRRDHFEAVADIWDLVSRIIAGRKERELDPAVAALERCVEEARGDATVHPTALARLEDMLAFTTLMDRWYGQMRALPISKLAAVIRLGARIVDFLPLGKVK